MTDGRTYADANPVQKVLRRFAASGPALALRPSPASHRSPC